MFLSCKWLVPSRAVLVGLVALLLLPSSVSAQPSAGWQFTVAPYLTGAAMEGTIGIGPVDADVNVSAGDILDALEFGVMGLFVARKGEWGAGADAIYMALGNTKDFAHTSAVAGVDQGAYSFYGARRLTDVAELTFGVRWNVLKTSIALTGPAGVSVNGDKQWVDPIVGLALRTPGTRRWHAALYSEAGGFWRRLRLRMAVVPDGRVRRVASFLDRRGLALDRHGLRERRRPRAVRVRHGDSGAHAGVAFRF